MNPIEPLVFLVDDDFSVREGLTSLVRSVGLRVEAFASAQEFLDFARPDAPTCLVLDVRMPGLSGLDLQRMLLDAKDRIPVIFITGHGDIPMTVRAMKAGALEFLPKPFREEDLLSAIREALAHNFITRQQQAERGELEHRYATLTAREREVMPLIVRGMLNKQVAADFGIAEVTIKVHRHNIMQKMKARSLPELVRMVEKLQSGVSSEGKDSAI
ncbi:two-component response regulator (plasmid) [Cupriavidus necator N-1]|uniref:Two-component response regulator n=1 Tax=Cupriavidus necator (strain ATCC 43291 / DSM 13513 / CCUG 52238 / LMG 8453 / N-1) TaxID=1042878 RepID=F8GVM1_CUPNN|nr:response regulator transcription factor [Cupriavidus necator]AEI82641.1 two-component response regulator [Cupriavidus necator N-1]MDX6007636.1 response regulator transcription factor [Cupriavidus necator]